MYLVSVKVVFGKRFFMKIMLSYKKRRIPAVHTAENAFLPSSDWIQFLFYFHNEFLYVHSGVWYIRLLHETDIGKTLPSVYRHRRVGQVRKSGSDNAGRK